MRKICFKRIRFILKIIPLLALSLCVAQSEPHDASKQQTIFSAGEEFEHPVVLPSAALKALETSKLSAEMLRDCALDEGIKVSEIPASWFVGSWIELSRGRSSRAGSRSQTRLFLGRTHNPVLVACRRTGMTTT
jgi:hypothetical protein